MVGDEDTAESEEILELVFGVMGRFKEHFMEAVKDLNLTPPQAHALRFLAQPVSQRELATCLGYDASNITGIVDRLEERGLVERQTDPDDRRVKQLLITPEGRAALERLRLNLVADNPLVANLDAAERRVFRDLLRKLVGAETSGPGWMIGAGGRSPTAAAP